MTRSCRDVLASLETYLDGESDEAFAAVLRRHLEECPPCLDRADFQRELRALIASRCRESAPTRLLDKVKADIEADTR
jgi:mycothiol system anti-sigma-R factor